MQINLERNTTDKDKDRQVIEEERQLALHLSIFFCYFEKSSSGELGGSHDAERH